MVELGRRTVLVGVVLMAGEAGTGRAAAAAAAPDGRTAWDFSFPALEGGALDFAAFRGRVMLVANTASFCGYTYQYEALEALHRELTPAGLTVLGVPSQDFNQESGSNEAVKTFCEATFGVQFPMAGISHVRGPDAAPFYGWVRAVRHWEPAWNFNKVLIGRDGLIKGTYGSKDEPNGKLLGGAIRQELAVQPGA